VGLILNIETSSPVCSVALARNGILIDSSSNRQDNTHAKLLTTLIEELIGKNNLLFSNLDAVAVSAGPGSYTGLRIGVSVAKGLCYALAKPLISVPTLLALGSGLVEKVNIKDSYYMPSLDARRMDIYTALYDKMGNNFLNVTCVTVNEELEKKISLFGEIYIGGSGAEKCKGIFRATNIHWVNGIDCEAKWMIKISNAKFIGNEFESTAYFEPDYLKEYLPGIKKLM